MACTRSIFDDLLRLRMSDELKSCIKTLLVKNLMLQMSPEEIGDEAPLFSVEGLGLDSIDALELAVAIEKNFGVPTPSAEVAREAFASVNTIARHILQNTP